jgi:hypothetical protein
MRESTNPLLMSGNASVADVRSDNTCQRDEQALGGNQ